MIKKSVTNHENEEESNSITESQDEIFNAAFSDSIEICDIFKEEDVFLDDTVFLSSNSTSFKHEQNDVIISDNLKNDATTKSCPQNLLLLKSWGLPDYILSKYEEQNITTMFPWQVECLSNKKILTGRQNLVYSAPTSAGKTLVAEILAIKTMLEHQKKVLFVLPFVSVVREKMFYFQNILGVNGIRVEGFMGSYNPPGGFQAVNMAICTIEKANNVINRALESETLLDIGMIIIDELHLLGDSHRGYLLELLLTKVQYMCVRDKLKIQIIGMSATLPNLNSLAKWLDAELYTTTFRPIPLNEQYYIGGEIYNNNFKFQRTVLQSCEIGTDVDNILQLSLETIEKSCSVLIFCPTKNWCENLAQQISVAFWKLGNSKTNFSEILRRQLNPEAISQLLDQLKKSPTGLDDMLHKTVSFGVAFHHAGLTMDEQDIIEHGFRSGTLKVLVATSTLSSGVNLPARRVIIRTPIFHGKPITNLTYKQMIGRAGRMGKDTAGESILICQKNDYNMALKVMYGELEPIESCLAGPGKLERAILEVIASNVVSSLENVELFVNCTLLAAMQATETLPIQEVISFLEKNQFIRLENDVFAPTHLGKACLSSSLPPDDALALFAELDKARQCFVLDTELHLIYSITPLSVCNIENLDWMIYLNLWEELPLSMRRVAEMVGVRESYIVNCTRGKIEPHKLQIHRRFFVSLALQELVNEVPLRQVAAKYNCSRGMLQSLQQSTATFAGMVTSFTRQLGWSNFEILISQFQDRLQFGINRDLLELMKLPILNSARARALFNNGIQTLSDLANSEVGGVENILHKVTPFENNKERDGESAFELKQRVKSIWVLGKQGLTAKEAALMLVNDARSYLQHEIGSVEIKWIEQTKQNIQTHSSPNTRAIKKSVVNLSPIPKAKLLSLNTSEQSLFGNSFEISPSDSGFMVQDDLEILQLETAFVNSLDLNDDDSEIKAKKRNRMKGKNDSDSFNLTGTPAKKKKISGQRNSQVKDDLINFECLEIVTVCDNKDLYNTFCNELKEQGKISLSIGCEAPDESKDKKYDWTNRKINGIAISWGSNTAYYVSFNSTKDVSQIDKITLIKSITDSKEKKVYLFDCKEQLKLLITNFKSQIKCTVKDPKVGDWLLQPEEKQKNLQTLALCHAPETVDLIKLCGDCKGVGSVGLSFESSTTPQLRASVEAIVTWHLNCGIHKTILEQNEKLFKLYDIEMKIMLSLAKVELNGICVDLPVLQQLANSMKQMQKAIEKEAFSMAGRQFSLISTKDVGRILKTYKTGLDKKQIEKTHNPLMNLIHEWRKINSALTKIIFPLIPKIREGRVCSHYLTHTATGRIAMAEPNLQSVPRNYEIEDLISHALLPIKCRMAFVASHRNVLLSGDYAQLELRLLAHFSRDNSLCSIMRSDADIFKSIAAKWNEIPESQVDDTQRQHAKQICYGVIYGMSSKTLANKMDLSVNEATGFIETFMDNYCGIRRFLKETVTNCRKNGYVETLLGRRRYLPNITSFSVNAKRQAERQAINTTIQGSAADIAKTAMISIDLALSEKYLNHNAVKLVLHLHDEMLYDVPANDAVQVAAIMKECMENAVALSVPLPVKFKTGNAWGQMNELAL